MYRQPVMCVDCGVEVPRSGGRGRPRVRCQQHFEAFTAAKAAKHIDKTLKDAVAAVDPQFRTAAAVGALYGIEAERDINVVR